MRGFMQNIQGFIFDMDGVIVDNHKSHFKAWMEFAKKYNFDLDDKIYREKFNGKTNRDLFTMIFGELTESEIYSYAMEKELRYQEIYRADMKPHHGLVDFLKHLNLIGAKIALGTSAPTMNVDFTLDTLGLRDYFHVIVDGSQVKLGKPDPEIYLKCLFLLGLPGENCVVFEDSLAGLDAGRSAGCHIIGVATSHSLEELKSRTSFLIKDFTEARELMRI
jgi:beta-phosphoglucomutase